MLAARRPTNTNLLKAITAVFFIAAFASCTVVRKYQPGKPFVYKTNINLIGKFSNEEAKELETGLQDQLDDSVKVKRVSKLLWSEIKEPPVFDIANADKSIIFMEALLKAKGYFNDSISYTYKTDTVKKHEYRTTLTFDVTPGKVFRLDTVIYNLVHPELQRLADSAKKDAYIAKGKPFSKTLISAELDRLTELFRDHGYLKFGRDEMVGLWDTLDVSLLRPSLDPFEQLEILQKLKAQKDNPSARLEITLRNTDTGRIRKYYNGTVTIYPDYTEDIGGLKREEVVIGTTTVIQYVDTSVRRKGKFRPRIFPAYIYFPYKGLYSREQYFRTLNRFGSLGSWRLVSIDPVPRAGEDTVDYLIKLTAAKKYSFNATLEGSVNQSVISGNLFGIGLNVGLQNRNFFRAANISNTNVRYGVELGNNSGDQFIQSRQIAISHNISIPRLIPNMRIVPESWRDNLRSILSLNAAKTERRLLYDLLTANASWGYEIQRKKNVLATLKLLNVEYSILNKKDSLDKLIQKNPSLRNLFTDGLVVSVIGNLTITGGKKDRLNVFRVNVEYAPFILEAFHTRFLDSQLYRFIKIDAEVARLMSFRKTSVALRLFAGVGIADPFGTGRNPAKQDNLPFFKEYFSGGPNSMRAWALRRLGQGSTVKEFSESPDRYGDVQIEANIEYRFPIGRPFGVLVTGALFTDIGNVWFLKRALNRPSEEIFNFGRLGKDIAIGAGAGLRIDFSFFVLRFDYAYKVKDPSPPPSFQHLQNKWFGYKFFDGDQFQLGINYPFIF